MDKWVDGWMNSTITRSHWKYKETELCKAPPVGRDSLTGRDYRLGSQLESSCPHPCEHSCCMNEKQTEERTESRGTAKVKSTGLSVWGG